MHFRLQPAEVSKLHRAAERAKKLGESAAKACAKAELDDHYGLELAGYAEEADLFLSKMTGGTCDLGARHCMALATGLRAILSDLEKDRETLAGLFVEVNEIDDGEREYRALLTKVRGGGEEPELELPASVVEAVERFRDSIPEGGSATISHAGRSVTLER